VTQVGLELHPDKTRIVYCKEDNAQARLSMSGSTSWVIRFVPGCRRAVHGDFFVNCSPAVSDDAAQAIRREIRRWRLHLRSDKSLSDLARAINPIVRGWINYYGRFCKSMLYPTLKRINEYLVRWARRKYKRLRAHDTKTRKWLHTVTRREPGLFAHW